MQDPSRSPRGKISNRQRRLRQVSVGVLAAAATCVHWALPALATTETWTVDNGDWATASDWNNGAGPVPGNEDTVDITDDDNTSRIVNYNYTGSPVALNFLTVDNDGSTGINTLSMTDSGVALAAGDEYIGDSNTSNLAGYAVLVQSAGTNVVADALYLGYGAFDGGVYTISGSASLQSNLEYVGVSGAATFFQTGGVNTVTSTVTSTGAGTLYVGQSSGSSGQYLLSGGSLSVSGEEIIADSGSGTFVQSGGTNDVIASSMNTVAGTFVLGNQYGSYGFYSLSGVGSLSVTGIEEVGLGGAGYFLQVGGTNAAYGLSVGVGTYSLAGSASLSVTGGEGIGSSISGANGAFFYQSGGTNTAFNLNLGETNGSSAIYSLGGTGSLSVASNEAVGFNGTGTFIQTAGNHNVGLSLFIAESGGSGAYTLCGGSLSVFSTEYVGYASPGTFLQSGGTNTSGTLQIGAYTVASGTYSLTGTGSLLAFDAYVGVYERGNFIQTGGSVSVAGTEYVGYSSNGTLTQSNGAATISGADSNGNGLSIGDHSGAQGIYNLSGGSLKVTSNETIGNGGTGTFNQTGGTNTVGNYLILGDGSDSSGTYSLDGAASLSVAENIRLGYYRTGNFIQASGTATVSGNIDLGFQSGAIGDYTITGGSLSVGGNVNIGGADSGAGGSGQFEIGGGQLTIGGTLRIWDSSGTNGLYITGGNTIAGNAVNDVSIYQNAGTSSLGAVSGAGNIDLGNQSGPAVTMTVTALTQNSMTIEPTGRLTMMGGASNNTLNQLTIGGAGVFDVTNGNFYVDYGTGSDPISTIAGYIKSGYNGGAWNGPGIISSAAQTPTNGLEYGVGYADGADGVVYGLSSGQIEIKYTLLGDVNLDGVVNGSDFSILAANFGQGYSNWDQGNFEFTPAINGADFAALAANFGQGDSGADVSVSQADIAALDLFAIANGLPLPTIGAVPEPACAVMFTMAGLGALARRRSR